MDVLIKWTYCTCFLLQCQASVGILSLYVVDRILTKKTLNVFGGRMWTEGGGSPASTKHIKGPLTVVTYNTRKLMICQVFFCV